MTEVNVEQDYDVLADADGTMPEIAADWLAASERAMVGTSRLSIPYGEDGLAYDVVLPEGPARGAVIFLHGGFWVQGSKDSILFAHPNFTRAGLCYVAVTYGLAPRYTLAELAANVEAAMHSFAGLAPDLGVDIARIALVGHSAGGYLAAAQAMSERGAFAPLGSLLISGLFDLRAIRNLRRVETLGLSKADAGHLSLDGRLLAGKGEIILAIGSREPAGFQKQTAGFARELRAAGGYPQVIIVPGCDHFGVARELGAQNSRLSNAVISFFE